MKLKFLNIVFQEPADFFAEINDAIASKRSIDTRAARILTFDSEKTFNNVMSVNKLQILRAISQQKPDSVYQLALLLGRKSLRPVLSFEYDVIRCDSAIIAPYTISERAEALLLGRTAT